MNTRKLSQLASLADGTEARTLIGQLNGRYDVCGRPFRVYRLAGGYQLLTRPVFSSWLRRLRSLPPETRLSAPAMETLAVVAYRQPALRADIEAVRGVASGEILRQLMDRDLVRVCGRSHELGRPYLYGTTMFFLEMFGLWSIEELPRPDLFKQSGHDKTNIANSPCLVGDRQAIDSVDVNSDVPLGERDSNVNAATDLEIQPLSGDVVGPQLSSQSSQGDGDDEWEDDDEWEGDDDDDEEDEDWDDDESEIEDDEVLDDEWEEIEEEDDDDLEDDDDFDDFEDEDEDEEYDDDDDDEEDWSES